MLAGSGGFDMFYCNIVNRQLSLLNITNLLSLLRDRQLSSQPSASMRVTAVGHGMLCAMNTEVPSLAPTVLTFFAFFTFIDESLAEQQSMTTVLYGKGAMDVEFIDENEKEMESYDENELYELRKWLLR